MADYKELLRRAVEALPENNGAARRAVYEKARAALVGQLRAINPPLAARDITTHRLQLEDCIRQVEQAASEAVIANIGQEPPPPPPKPVAAEAPKPAPQPKAAPTPQPQQAPRPHLNGKAATPPPAAAKGPAKSGSIEDIIAAAERDRQSAPPPSVEAKPPEIKARPPKSQPVLVARNPEPEDEGHVPPVRPAQRQSNRPLPSIVARAEAVKNRPLTPIEGGRGRQTVEPRRDSRGAVAARNLDPYEETQEFEAMSAVREVEVEPQPADPQGAIDRAIATLDREARGDAEPPVDESYDDEPMPALPPRRNGKVMNGLAALREDMPPMRNGRAGAPKPAHQFATSARTRNDYAPSRSAARERGGMGAVSIFLIVFVLLLLGAGGAGFWAWQEGYLNLDAMFGKGQPAVVETATAQPLAATPGPGNTEAAPATTQPSTELKSEDRLAAAPVTTAEPSAALALQTPAPAANDRLGGDTSASEAAVAAIDPATTAGSQSLLLEASDKGTTGAVPFSGTVEWSKGVDETGLPTLIGKANIPARNLQVDVLIRKNSDPSLPASHLMEVNFTVNDGFLGGSIAGLPGVLLKNEELVQGSPLVGASARVVGNSFLFALSATPEDSNANVTLLTSRKWIDLALIYATGKRAIITLEKDAAAQKMFTEVFAAWGQKTTASG
ncbi:MAG TPA: hypothetical protein VG757_13810 [Devosia sp.]|nr:hypothetical protein [Devosia sp.]